MRSSPARFRVPLAVLLTLPVAALFAAAGFCGETADDLGESTCP